ncbi:MAG: Na+/H+ antiporter subunit D [Aliihoeflea sp.]
MESASNPYGVDISQAMILERVALADWLLVFPVALPLLTAAILVMMRRHPNLHAPISLGVIGVVLFSNVVLLARVLDDGPFAMMMGRWLPPFGITFVADTLGVLLAATAALVALVCALFGSTTINATGKRYGFYPFLMLLMTGVGGSFLTGDIFNLYVWFEVFLISSFGLLILGSERAQLDGAFKYAILNLVATTLFLIATGLLYGVFGTLNMADIALKSEALRGEGPLMMLATLYLVAFGMKAAAFPLHFWLPASYHTPRLVVGALFGALLTKVGVYALLRTLFVLLPQEGGALSGVIAVVAVLTMVFGAIGALAQADIRRIMGYVVISGIGIMMAGLALGNEVGLAGTVLYAVHSMLVMAALYLLVALMRQVGGSYSLADLGGLYRLHPLLAAIALLLVLSAAGLPPGSGLWPKVMLVKSALDEGAGWIAFAILLSGLLTTLALGRVFALAFWRPRAGGSMAETVTLDRTGMFALGILMIPILWIGLYPEPVLAMANAAAASLLDPVGYSLLVLPAGGGS